MKKLFLVLVTATILLGGTMSVKAYETTTDGVQCGCIITGKKDVKAFTAVGMGTTTVIIRSNAYDRDGNLLGGSGNSGGGYAKAEYSVSGANIYYAVQEHEVPSYNVLEKLTQYAY